MKRMLSKFAGQCAHCKGRIAKGTEIAYLGRGEGAYHIACYENAAGDEDKPEVDEDEAAGFEPGTLASDRHLARNGLNVVRFSSGQSMTQNSRGRCEDAPCCGCCTF